MLSTYKGLPLNACQTSLLNKYSECGLTATHFSTWIPYVPHDEAAPIFASGHHDAVDFFIKKIRMKPMEALAAIKGLTSLEASLLPLFYSAGLTADFILEHSDHYQFNHLLFHECLIFLTKQKKLTLEFALNELEYLHTGELVVLLDLYPKGLRGAHLRQYNVSEQCDLYLTYRNDDIKSDSSARDAAKYFLKVFHYSRTKKSLKPGGALLEACSELMKIKNNVRTGNRSDDSHVLFTQSSKRINFLLAYAYLGVRADDYPRVFNDMQSKVFRMLRFYYSLELLPALKEMQGLSDDQLAFLCKYYGAGLYHRKLESFPHHTDFCESFMRRLRWTPLQAVDNLAALSSDQLLYFHFLQPFGLTYAQVNLLEPATPFTSIRKDAAIFLINEKGYAPLLAAQEVISSSDDELLNMMKEHAVAFVSFRPYSTPHE